MTKSMNKKSKNKKRKIPQNRNIREDSIFIKSLGNNGRFWFKIKTLKFSKNEDKKCWLTDRDGFKYSCQLSNRELVRVFSMFGLLVISQEIVINLNFVLLSAPFDLSKITLIGGIAYDVVKSKQDLIREFCDENDIICWSELLNHPKLLILLNN